MFGINASNLSLQKGLDRARFVIDLLLEKHSAAPAVIRPAKERIHRGKSVVHTRGDR